VASGEEFKPKRIMLRGNIVETVNIGQMIDGAVDIDMTPEMALTGMATRRLSADPPGAFIFVCHCGWKRRVTHTETNFRCERGGVGVDCKCDILWKRQQKKTDEVDENGMPVYADVTVPETVEAVDEYSGKTIKRKIDVPVFIGRKVGELRAEEFARRKEAGEPIYSNPSDHKDMRQYGNQKQEPKK
jgi:hypothetical protein